MSSGYLLVYAVVEYTLVILRFFIPTFLRYLKQNYGKGTCVRYIGIKIKDHTSEYRQVRSKSLIFYSVDGRRL